MTRAPGVLARKVLVSGASRGIGRAACERLLADGHRVVGLARGVAEVADAVDAGRGRFEPVPVDLADLAGLPRLLSALVRRHPDLDALVCNAGQGRFGALEEFSYRQIGELMDLNFTAQAYLTRALLPLLKRSAARGRPADVLFVGSEAALSGGRRGAVYSAGKAALRGFAQALRGECARAGVRVCTINPGAVRSGFFEQLHFAPGDSDDNALSVEEVADAVAWVLGQRPGAVIDEINLSPLKTVWRFHNS